MAAGEARMTSRGYLKREPPTVCLLALEGVHSDEQGGRKLPEIALWSTTGLLKHSVGAQLVGPCSRRSGGMCCSCLIVIFPLSRFRSKHCVKSQIRLNTTPSSFGTGAPLLGLRVWGYLQCFSQCFEMRGQHPATLPPCSCIKHGELAVGWP